MSSRLTTDCSKQQTELLEGMSNGTTWKLRAMILLCGINKTEDIVEGRLALLTEPAADAREAVKKTYEKDLEAFTQAEAMAQCNNCKSVSRSSEDGNAVCNSMRNMFGAESTF
jgi:hypothetical protein